MYYVKSHRDDVKKVHFKRISSCGLKSINKPMFVSRTKLVAGGRTRVKWRICASEAKEARLLDSFFISTGWALCTDCLLGVPGICLLTATALPLLYELYLVFLDWRAHSRDFAFQVSAAARECFWKDFFFGMFTFRVVFFAGFGLRRVDVRFVFLTKFWLFLE